MEKTAIKNRTLFTADNLVVLRGMESSSVDLVYLDPPFNSNRHYSAPIGSQAAGAEFKDAWTYDDINHAWWGELADKNEPLYRVIDAASITGGAGSKAYLIYLAIRILELHRILKDSGSLYLHCDPTMSHGIKLMLDAIFGSDRFQNEIIWHYTGGGRAKRYFSRKHDVIFYYGKTKHPTFNLDSTRIPYKPTSGYAKAGIVSKAGKHYLPNPAGTPADDVWDIPIINPMAKERTGYPTQKPLKLLQRIIAASSQEGERILDPFCGCATTCVAAEQLKREWIGIDINEQSLNLLKARITLEIGGYIPVVHRHNPPFQHTYNSLPDAKHILFGQQEGQCNGCKIAFPFSHFVVEHIVGKSIGEQHTTDNWQLLCNHCHVIKSNQNRSYLMATLNKQHPHSHIGASD